MATLVFDTLKFAERLQGGGFTEQQAKTAAAALNESFASEVISRGYFDMRLTELEQRIVMVEQRIVIKLGGMIVAATAFMTAFLTAIKYWG